MGDIQTIQSNQNYLPEPDENGLPMINPTYYKNILSDYIENYIQENGIERTKLNNNNILSISISLYENIFTNHVNPNKPNNPKPRCNIPYTTYNIQTLLYIYKTTLIKYNCVPSLYGFYTMTGIQEETVKKYVTTSQVEITNTRKEMLRNELYNDRMGRIVLANNDTSFGLEYEKKNTLERETIKQGLTLQELPRLD